MKRVLLVLGLGLFVFNAVAAEQNGVKFDETLTLEGKNLTLNGLGTRIVHKFGIPVKVYVAGLYLEKKNSDSDVLVKNDEVKKLILTFVRPVDRDAIIDAFRIGYEDSCFVDCATLGAQFKPFAESVVNVRKGNSIMLTFYKDKMEVDTNGPNAKKQVINDAKLSRNMLSVFIDKNKNPGKDFRKGLLGL